MDKSEGMVLLLIPSTNSRAGRLGGSQPHPWCKQLLPMAWAFWNLDATLYLGTQTCPEWNQMSLRLEKNQKKWPQKSERMVVATQIHSSFYFQPEPWKNDPIWRAYFSNRLVQPPNSERMVTKFFWVYKCFLMAMFQASGMYRAECFFQDFTGCFSFWWAFKTTFFPPLGNLHES